jgi:hypothetical protein
VHRRLAHSRRETAHGGMETAHGRGFSTFERVSWADWAGSSMVGVWCPWTVVVLHVSPSWHGDDAVPVGASRDRTEGLGDEFRNYDPSGGTGRFKSSRPDHNNNCQVDAPCDGEAVRAGRGRAHEPDHAREQVGEHGD